MVDLLQTQKDYIEATNGLNRVLTKEIDFTDNPFVNNFKFFKAFQFENLYSEELYKGLLDFLKRRHSKSMIFYTIDPPPEKYFFPHFSKYSIAKINIDTSYDEYLDFLDLDPGNSPADALRYNAETIALFSEEPVWGITGSKDLEIGIAGFTGVDIGVEFLNSFRNNIFYDVDYVLSGLYNPLEINSETKAIHLKIKQSYSEKI